MRILFLTQILPFPPDAGPRVKTWHVLRHLAGHGHEIELASFLRPEEEEHIGAVRQVCAAVHTVPIRRSRAADIGYWLRSHVTGRPFLVERDDQEAMHRLIQDLLSRNPFDVIHADQLTMAQFALAADKLSAGTGRESNTRSTPAQAGGEIAKASNSGPRLIFDAHNAVWTILDRARQNGNPFLRPVLAIEAGRVRRYEGSLIGQFDATLAVSEVDREALRQAVAASTGADGHDPSLANTSITVIPIAVDVAASPPIARARGTKTILALGSLNYPPNADGVRWFAREVFPVVRRSVPGAQLVVVGKGPPRDLVNLAHESGEAMRVEGYVPDLNPYLQRADVMVVPVRAGGGMRVRILEGFAWAIPMVTTTVGLEGICATPDQDILVADSPDEFAGEVVSVLRSEAIQDRLAANGRQLVKEKYDVRVVLSKLDDVYRRLEGQAHA